SRGMPDTSGYSPESSANALLIAARQDRRCPTTATARLPATLVALDLFLVRHGDGGFLGRKLRRHTTLQALVRADVLLADLLVDWIPHFLRDRLTDRLVQLGHQCLLMPFGLREP